MTIKISALAYAWKSKNINDDSKDNYDNTKSQANRDQLQILRDSFKYKSQKAVDDMDHALDSSSPYACKHGDCLPIRRMISGLIFYSTINPISNPKHESKFMEYCAETYPELLNDYIHIMDNHQNDMDKVAQVMKTDFDLMNDCMLQNCQMVMRHYRDKNKPLLNESIINYDELKLSTLLREHDTFNCADINQWKDQIADYILMEKINGKTLLTQLSRDVFTQNISTYFNDIKLRDVAMVIYDKLLESHQICYSGYSDTEDNKDLVFYIDLMDSILPLLGYNFDKS